jgi:hypothetical protein
MGIEEINPKFFHCFILSILSIHVNYSLAAARVRKGCGQTALGGASLLN